MYVKTDPVMLELIQSETLHSAPEKHRGYVQGDGLCQV